MPIWANFDTSTGELSGTPIEENIGTSENIKIIVTDIYGAESSLATFNIEVILRNDPPVIGAELNSPTTNVNQGQQYSYIPNDISDPEGDALSYFVTNLPTWATINATTGEISGIPTNEDVGSHNAIVLNVYDGVSSIGLPTFNITVININDAPTITGIPSANAIEDSEYVFAPIGNDIDVGDSVTFNITNMPSWATFNAITGVLSGIPENNDVGTHNAITITITDSYDEVATLNAFDITVINTNDSPIITGTPNTTVNEDSLYSFVAVGSDIDLGDTLTYSVTNKPSWATLNATTGELSGTPENNNVGDFNDIVISLSDGTELISLPTFNISVINTNDAPIISGTPNSSVIDNTEYSFTPVGSDVDTGDTFTFNISGLPSWASFSTENGRVLGTPTLSDVGTYDDIVISIIDSNGAVTAMPTFNISVNRTSIASIISPYAGTFNGIESLGNDLVIWLDAMNIDGQKNATMTNGDSVASWIDGTGTVGVLTQDSDVLKPEYLNNAILFDTGEFLSSDLAISNDNDQITIVTVYKVNSTNANTPLFIGDTSGSTDSANGLGFGYNSAQQAYYMSAAGWASDVYQAGVTNELNIQTAVLDDNSLKVKVNNQDISTITVDSSYDVADILTGVMIGKSPDGNTFFDGAIHEVLVFNNSLDEDQINGLYAYLAMKWQLESIDSDGDGFADLGETVYGSSIIDATDIPAQITITNNLITSVNEDSVYDFTPQLSFTNDSLVTFNITNLPTWATFSTSNGQIIGTPENDHVGVYSDISISYSDMFGRVQTIPTFDITVINTNDHPVVVESFKPTHVKGLKVWLDGFNVDGQNNETLANNDLVDTWVDLSGNDNHATQSSPDHRPTFTTESWIGSWWLSQGGNQYESGIPGFRFFNDETRDGFNTISGGNGINNRGVNFKIDTPFENDFTIIIVGQEIHRGAGGGGDHFNRIGVIGDKTGFAMSFGNAVMLHGIHGTGTKPGIDDNFYFPNNKRIINLFQRDQSEGLIRFSAQDPTPDNIKTGLSIDPINSESTFIGSTGINDEESNQIFGQIQEVIIFDEIVSDEDMYKIYYYLSNKWKFEDTWSYQGVQTYTTDSDDDGIVDSEDNDNPALNISPVPLSSINEGDNYLFVPQVMDPDGDTFTFNISNQPSWMAINSTTGVVSGRPDNSDIGTYSDIIVTAVDAFGAVGSIATINVTVIDINDAPIVSEVGSQSVYENDSYSFIPQVTDADGDGLTYTVNNLPSWATFNSVNAQISGTPTSADIGFYDNIEISVSDGTDITKFEVSIDVLAVNVAPVISGVPSTNVDEDSAYSFIPTGSDSNSSDSIYYSINNMPSWAEFNAATGELSGIPTNDDVGVHSDIEISVTDYQPVSIFPTSMVLHLDAMNVDGLKNTTINDGDGVSTWTDLSGNNHHATQTQLTHQPTFEDNGLLFDGHLSTLMINDHADLQIGTGAGKQFSMIVVYSSNRINDDEVIIGRQSSSNEVDYLIKSQHETQPRPLIVGTGSNTDPGSLAVNVKTTRKYHEYCNTIIGSNG